MIINLSKDVRIIKSGHGWSVEKRVGSTTEETVMMSGVKRKRVVLWEPVGRANDKAMRALAEAVLGEGKATR